MSSGDNTSSHQKIFSGLQASARGIAAQLRQAGLVPSNKEAVRMIGQGAVRVAGEVVADSDATFAATELDGVLVQVGKRRWARILAPGA